MNAWFLLLIPATYLLGSVPFGLLMARAKGIDLRNVGSGNIGATNVSRALGRKWAYVCFVLDCCKGLGPMLLGGLLIQHEAISIVSLFLWLAVGCAAILGHIFSVYLKFTGGKGAATGMGVMLGLYPFYTIPGLITFMIWVVLVLLFRYISLATIIGSAAFPISLAIVIALLDSWTFASLWPLVLVAAIIAILVIIRHAENIKRLLEGSEAKVLQRQR
ncbi:MAG: glycerol-3-phosphate 1-O-acyltransferase PlsY [Sedimentisphaerales bacterium]|nr:glycerol-3-phosphate 1-O-acyltransferase PlsY [Sedimentisphaerales bacterium]